MWGSGETEMVIRLSCSIHPILTAFLNLMQSALVLNVQIRNYTGELPNACEWSQECKAREMTSS